MRYEHDQNFMHAGNFLALHVCLQDDFPLFFEFKQLVVRDTKGEEWELNGLFRLDPLRRAIGGRTFYVELSAKGCGTTPINLSSHEASNYFRVLSGHFREFYPVTKGDWSLHPDGNLVCKSRDISIGDFRTWPDSARHVFLNAQKGKSDFEDLQYLLKLSVWTDEAPTEPGWYWVNTSDGGSGRKTRPIRITKDSLATNLGLSELIVNCVEFGIFPLKRTEQYDYLWGPRIEEPEKPQ